MSRTLAVVAAVLALFFFGSQVPGWAAGEEGRVLTLFYLDTCPHCAAEKEFLADLAADYPDLEIRKYEVSSDNSARALFASMAADHGIEAKSVPTTFFAGRVWVGFDDTKADEMRAAVAAGLGSTLIGPIPGEAAPEPAEEPASPTSERAVVDVPLVGGVDVGDRSLLVATLVIGFVDGVNPCSLWALTVLLALVLHSGSRRRVFFVGATFLAVTTGLYGLYIVGIYTLLAYAAYLVWIQRGVAAVAGGMGLVNLKDYFFAGRGPSLSIPQRRKPGIYERARALGGDGKSTVAILAGTAALAVGVSLAETPCTAGLPVLWTNMLSSRDVGTAAAVPLFALYMALFLVDELIVFGAAVVTMRVTKLQEHHGRLLKLVTGSVMVALAAAMIFDPGRLDTVAGTVQVFGVALAASAIVAGLEQLVQRSRHPLHAR